MPEASGPKETRLPRRSRIDVMSRLRGNDHMHPDWEEVGDGPQIGHRADGFELLHAVIGPVGHVRMDQSGFDLAPSDGQQVFDRSAFGLRDGDQARDAAASALEAGQDPGGLVMPAAIELPRA